MHGNYALYKKMKKEIFTMRIKHIDQNNQKTNNNYEYISRNAQLLNQFLHEHKEVKLAAMGPASTYNVFKIIGLSQATLKARGENLVAEEFYVEPVTLTLPDGSESKGKINCIHVCLV